ncbi:MAG: AMP-binding protein [Acidimicrobiia bacterium]|nr:AMP-binding protein [Acidimicrobiia bacterium]
MALHLEGDQVATLSTGFSREHLEAEHWIMAVGLVRMPLDPSTPPAEIAAQLAHAGPTRSCSSAPSRMPSPPSITTSACGSTSAPPSSRRCGRTAVSPLPLLGLHDLASLNLTGGTTGAPKAWP